MLAKLFRQSEKRHSNERRANLPQSGDQCQVKVEHVLEPLNGGSGLVCEDLDEVRTSLLTSRLEGVIVELLDGVADVVVDLGAGQGTVDAGGGLGRVTTEETCARESAFRGKCSRASHHRCGARIGPGIAGL